MGEIRHNTFLMVVLQFLSIYRSWASLTAARSAVVRVYIVPRTDGESSQQYAAQYKGELMVII